MLSDPLEYQAVERLASRWDLPTPALIVDLDALERNLDRMAAFYRGKPAALRPHCKTHKSPVIARQQLARGAAGICVAKLSEAEVMLAAGVEDVLVTTGVVDRPRIRRLVSLARDNPGLKIVTDHEANVEDLAEAAGAAHATLTVLVDLNCGSNRTGASLGSPAVALAAAVARKPSLRFAGFQAFASHIMHMEGFESRRRADLAMLEEVVETRHLAEQAGLGVEILSVGGTGTFDIDGDVPGVTDVQAGSYVFMDVMYRAIGGSAGPVFDAFEPALFILSTAISQPVAGEITVDAGYKASATDHQPPQPVGLGDVSYRWAGDEHGILTLRRPSRDIRIGDQILLLASHCDPTVNLYDWYEVCRGDRVVDRWRVSGRGMSQ
jgi:D-serine deaminase-like pyridoxal phosphate-dependent protein